MAIETVDLPMKNGDFPWQNVSSPEGIQHFKPFTHQKWFILLLDSVNLGPADPCPSPTLAVGSSILKIFYNYKWKITSQPPKDENFLWTIKD